MSTLDITIVQADLHWHEPPSNREQLASVIESLESDTDLIVLPEMFTTGFTMDAVSYAESMEGESMAWLANAASRAQASVCGSLIIRDQGEYFNRFICMRPDGNYHCYDKRHLFRLADEHHHYTPGTEIVTFELDGWRICPMVCYDLRFPAWSRNHDAYDVLVYVANWPSRRHHAWETLLRARAIENLAYAVGVNRTGTDGNNLPYAGGSAIVDYLGEDMINLSDRVGAASATLDMASLQKFREKFPFHADADAFTLG